MSEEGTPPAEAELRASLSALKLSALKKRAKEAGVAEAKLEEADDADDVKGTVVELILEKEAVSASEKLRDELGSLKLSALKKRAKEVGVDEGKLEEADDADNVKGAVIELILEELSKTAESPEALKEEQVMQLREELEAMKLSAVKKRAKEAGVDEGKLEEADDADDVQSAVIDLIVENMLQEEDASGAEAAAELAQIQMRKEEELQKLRTELEGMKLSAVKKRAKQVGVDEGKLEEADDAGDVQSAVIELIVDKSRDQPEPSGTAAVKPHFSSADSGVSTAARLKSMFGKKHCMFSYNWGVQDDVKAARSEVGGAGVPTWMDIDGGMKADIFDSMAEGVTNAACVVCFMTQSYQDSANCALELKFAKQSGVPIVPVMMEAPDSSGRSWQAGGWLGVITAGSLWTPLYDPATFDENIPNLLRQIEVAVAPEEGDDETAADFSADDVREELERLRKDEQPAVISTTGGMCALSAQVPKLPEGLRITPEVQQLLTALLTSEKKRIGFCGMGGIGKTTISTWLVREEGTRKQYEQIVWVALGQHPNIEKLQSLVMLQCTDADFEGDPTPEMKRESLKKAMAGKNLLFVLDDLWESEHEELLNFIDDTTASKVLVSSRVRGVLEGAEIVDIGLPTLDEAVQMLLSVAGLPLDAAVPPEAREVVKFCDLLPLAIGIAGKLVHEMGVTDDWDGVVELMQEEFSDSGQDRGMEERIIRTSLSAIKGPHRDKILRLFNAFAIVPEDIQIPIEMVAMLFEAESETPLPKPPPLLNIRRWLKVLIDRSLILGTVDRPSLHDIVMDFVTGAKSDEARRGMTRRLVDLWRSRRPLGGWDVESSESVPQYITLTAVHHISGAWETDWSKDEGAIAWLSDFVDGKQDAIPVFAAQALGPDRAAELAKAAESAEDWWLASLRWSASAVSEHRRGGYAKSLPLLQESAKTLERVEAEKTRNQLETSVLIKALQSYSQEIDIPGYTTRIEQNPEAVDIFAMTNFVQYTEMLPSMFAGDGKGLGLATVKVMKMCLDTLAEVHESDHTQRCKLLSWHSWSGFMSTEVHGLDFDWDGIYGEGGSHLAELTHHYDYDRMHLVNRKWSGYDLTLGCPGWASAPLSHWGDLAAANAAFDRMLPFAFRCLEDCVPTDLQESFYFHSVWPFWLYTMGRKDDARALLHAKPFDDDLGQLSDWLCEHWPQLYGPKKDGHIAASEDFLMHSQFLDVLLAKATPPASAVTGLPEPHEVAMLGVTLPWGSVCNLDSFVTMVPAMLAHERVGSDEGALAFVKIILEAELPKGGTVCKRQHSFAHACRGRILAAQGNADEAEAAFESAAEAAEAGGCHFFTAIWLRDLCKHVLDGAGRGEEGRKRLEEAVSRLACSVEDLDAIVYP